MQKTPERPDALFTVFPNIRHGRDYDLNWEFNNYKITPDEEAYRNLHLRGLQMLAPGKSDAQKAIHVKTEQVPDHQIYFVPSNNVQVANEHAVPSSAWRSAIRQVGPNSNHSNGSTATDRICLHLCRFAWSSPTNLHCLWLTVALVPLVLPPCQLV